MAIQKRYDFVLLFDVQDGNPNGTQTPGTCRASMRRQDMAS